MQKKGFIFSIFIFFQSSVFLAQLQCPAKKSAQRQKPCGEARWKGFSFEGCRKHEIRNHVYFELNSWGCLFECELNLQKKKKFCFQFLFLSTRGFFCTAAVCPAKKPAQRWEACGEARWRGRCLAGNSTVFYYSSVLCIQKNAIPKLQIDSNSRYSSQNYLNFCIFAHLR